MLSPKYSTTFNPHGTQCPYCEHVDTDLEGFKEDNITICSHCNSKYYGGTFVQYTGEPNCELNKKDHDFQDSGYLPNSRFCRICGKHQFKPTESESGKSTETLGTP